MMGSSLAYYLAAAAGCGLEPGGAADFHSGTKEYAGKDHQVRIHTARRGIYGFGGLTAA